VAKYSSPPEVGYGSHLRLFTRGNSDGRVTSINNKLSELHDEIELQLIAAERQQINDLYQSEKLKDEARRGIERELDLHQAHLLNQRAEK